VTAPVFTLHGALQRAAADAGERTAVTSATETLTYAELAQRAGRITTALLELGAAPGDRVAVWAAKSPSTVAALYGILGAGCAYVPIDPLSPPRRATTIIGDAGSTIVCADSRRAELLASVDDGPAARVVGLEPDVAGATIDAGALGALTADTMARGCESDLAYILYTSGSTGTPKGVMLTHRNALSFVEWTVGRFGVGAEDRLVSHAPFHFDLSVFDLYGAALAGASVHLLTGGETGFGTALATAAREQQITVWYSVPSALVMLCDAAEPADVACLRVVLFAGEVFPIKHLVRLRELVPSAVLANLYGPTETNVCTYHVVPDVITETDRTLPIGRACENQEVFALDESLKPVPRGEVGVLWARGPTVMQGYWADPERTATSLRQNPLHDRYPDPAYCTGDLVRERDDGEFDFLGRRDHQVKSRGYRIELGEIEAALLAHPSVREAAVVAVPDEEIGHALFGFVAAPDGVEAIALKRHCASYVPRYMIPGEIIVSSELPHTSTGKIDRQALAQRAAGGE
jgi:amino acid adenylation domain-containing protein